MENKLVVIKVKKIFRGGETNTKLVLLIPMNCSKNEEEEYINDEIQNWAGMDPGGLNYGYSLNAEDVYDEEEKQKALSSYLNQLKSEEKSLSKTISQFEKFIK